MTRLIGSVDNGLSLSVDFPFYTGICGVQVKEKVITIAIRRKMPAKGRYEGVVGNRRVAVDSIEAHVGGPGLIIVTCHVID